MSVRIRVRVRVRLSLIDGRVCNGISVRVLCPLRRSECVACGCDDKDGAGGEDEGE